MDSTSAEDGYCRGAVFICCRIGENKKKRATRLSNNAVHDKKLISY